MKKKLFIVVPLVLAILVVVSLFTHKSKESKNITIAGIVFQNDLYMRTVQLGMEAAGKENGITVLLGNSDNKVDKEAQLIDTYIARKVDAIVIMPISADSGSDAAIQRAVDAGIKIVYANTTANVPAVSHIGTSNLIVGEAAGKAARAFILKNFPNQDVPVATLSFRSQLPEPAEQRSSGFFNQIKDIPGVELVAEQDAWLAEMAIRVVGDMLTSNPDIKIIHAANEGGTVGAVQAVRNAGLQGKVFVFGTDGSDQIVQMLLDEDNVLQSAAAQGPFEVGKTSIETALKSLKGETVPSDIEIPPKVLLRDDPDDLRAFQKELKSYQ